MFLTAVVVVSRHAAARHLLAPRGHRDSEAGGRHRPLRARPVPHRGPAAGRGGRGARVHRAVGVRVLRRRRSSAALFSFLDVGQGGPTRLDPRLLRRAVRHRRCDGPARQRRRGAKVPAGYERRSSRCSSLAEPAGAARRAARTSPSGSRPSAPRSTRAAVEQGRGAVGGRPARAHGPRLGGAAPPSCRRSAATLELKAALARSEADAGPRRAARAPGPPRPPAVATLYRLLKEDRLTRLVSAQTLRRAGAQRARAGHAGARPTWRARAARGALALRGAARRARLERLEDSATAGAHGAHERAGDGEGPPARARRPPPHAERRGQQEQPHRERPRAAPRPSCRRWCRS